MVNDPEEKVNQINNPEYAGRIREMAARVKKYIEDGRSTPGAKAACTPGTGKGETASKDAGTAVRLRSKDLRIPESNAEVFNWRQRAGAGHARRY